MRFFAVVCAIYKKEKAVTNSLLARQISYTALLRWSGRVCNLGGIVKSRKSNKTFKRELAMSIFILRVDVLPDVQIFSNLALRKISILA